jgi:endonuclease/exonuclease/phosphatase family metal-dependent hydrolase
MNVRPKIFLARKRPLSRPQLSRWIFGLTLALVWPLGLLPAHAASSTNGQDGRVGLRVITQNLYLGASLTPALTAKTGEEFLQAIATIYGKAQASDYRARASAFAAEAERTQPHVIALQEVVRWETSGPGVAGELDFLTIVQAALKDRGLEYEVAVAGVNAQLGPLPLISPCDSTTLGACQVSLIDRDVILVRSNRPHLSWSDPQSGRFAAQAAAPVPGGGTVSLDRGWVSVLVTRLGRTVRVANTHLEVSGFPDIQQQQAAELRTQLAGETKRTIVVGDFNSAADGSTTPTYADMVVDYADAWPPAAGEGFTCCLAEDLSGGTLSRRIDFLFYRGRVMRVRDAELVGAEPFQQQTPRYISDHHGVLAAFGLGKVRSLAP